MGLDIIELAPTGRAKCMDCKRRIRKDTPRGIVNEPDSFNRMQKYFICYKCALEWIEIRFNKQKKLKDTLKRLTKKHTKEIILMELEKDGK